MRLLLPLTCALLFLAACSGSGDDLPVVSTTPVSTPTGAPWPTVGRSNIISAHSGVPLETILCPTGPALTPTPSSLAVCDSPPAKPDPSKIAAIAAFANFAPTTGDPPATPPYRAVSDYFDFGDTSAISGLGSIAMDAPLKYTVPTRYKLEFFEYSNGDWIDLQPAQSDGYTAAAGFNPFPPNLNVLAVPKQ